MIAKLRKRRLSLVAARRRLALALTAGAVLLSAGIFAAPAHAAANVYCVAFQGSNDDLWYYMSTPSGAGPHDTGIAMDGFSDPSIGLVNGGDGPSYMIAFDNAYEQLMFYYPESGQSIGSGIQMESGTHPSIAANDVVAFQGYNGHLWYWNGTGHDTGIFMNGTTDDSPSITPEGNYIAFRGDDNSVWVYSMSTGQATDTHLGMNYNTSVSIGNSGSGSYWVAFEANTNVLWYYIPGYGGYNTGHAMEPDTSPSLAPNSGMMAFADTNRHLNVYNAGAKTDLVTGLGLDPYSSPDLSLVKDSTTGATTGYESWFQANGSNELFYFNSTTGADGNTGVTVGYDGEDGHFVSYTTGVQFVIG
jgi:hypothetical protein